MKTEEQHRQEAYAVMKQVQTVLVGAICIGTKLANGVPVPQSESDAFALEGKLLVDAIDRSRD